MMDGDIRDSLLFFPTPAYKPFSLVNCHINKPFSYGSSYGLTHDWRKPENVASVSPVALAKNV